MTLIEVVIKPLNLNRNSNLQEIAGKTTYWTIHWQDCKNSVLDNPISEWVNLVIIKPITFKRECSNVLLNLFNNYPQLKKIVNSQTGNLVNENINESKKQLVSDLIQIRNQAKRENQIELSRKINLLLENVLSDILYQAAKKRGERWLDKSSIPNIEKNFHEYWEIGKDIICNRESILQQWIDKYDPNNLDFNVYLNHKIHDKMRDKFDQLYGVGKHSVWGKYKKQSRIKLRELYKTLGFSETKICQGIYASKSLFEVFAPNPQTGKYPFQPSEKEYREATNLYNLKYQNSQGFLGIKEFEQIIIATFNYLKQEQNSNKTISLDSVDNNFVSSEFPNFFSEMEIYQEESQKYSQLKSYILKLIKIDKQQLSKIPIGLVIVLYYGFNLKQEHIVTLLLLNVKKEQKSNFKKHNQIQHKGLSQANISRRLPAFFIKLLAFDRSYFQNNFLANSHPNFNQNLEKWLEKNKNSAENILKEIRKDDPNFDQKLNEKINKLESYIKDYIKKLVIDNIISEKLKQQLRQTENEDEIHQLLQDAVNIYVTETLGISLKPAFANTSLHQLILNYHIAEHNKLTPEKFHNLTTNLQKFIAIIRKKIQEL